MEKIASIVGRQVERKHKEPRVAVVRCAGSPAQRAEVIRWDGAASCRVSAALLKRHSGAARTCLGMGDCVSVCEFGALRMGPRLICRWWTRNYVVR